MKATEHELWQDEQAAAQLSRDRHREPSSARPRLPRLRSDVGPPPRTLRLSCPQCNGPVYTVEFSDREFVECTAPDCRAALKTRLQIDGTVALVLVEAAP